MIRRAILVVVGALAVLIAAPALAMVPVGPGQWRPLYPGEGEESIAVSAFWLDVAPVTNAEFAAFVDRQPKWRHDNVPELFAGHRYLNHWKDDAAQRATGQPVTNVSWWAARAYCEERGARLPLEREWELAAMASSTVPDASRDPEFLAEILRWYSTPGATLAAAGSGPPNFWGVRDLHGLVWEWVEDFQSALVAVDNREDGTVDTARFCGAGAVNASNKDDYAAFMRLAFRASLRADFATSNLGFRCARDTPPEEVP